MNKLPSEVVPWHRPKKMIYNLVLALLILGSINLAMLVYFKHYNPNKAYALIQHKWQMIFDTSLKVDWLILGDSSGNQGMAAQRFEEEFGEKALNLCTIADMLLVNDVWMLEKYIERHGSPKNLVLVHTYDIWHREALPTGYLAQIPVFLQGDTSISLAHLALANWKKCWMNNMPLNYQRASIAWLIQHPTYWFQPAFQCDVTGFEIRPLANETEVLRDSKEHLNFVQSHTFEVSSSNLQALEQLARLAAQHHINVYLANAPIYEKLYEDKKFQGYYQAMQTFMALFCQRHHWDYVNPSPMTFPAQDMENADHLTAGAAQRFTDEFIQELERRE